MSQKMKLVDWRHGWRRWVEGWWFMAFWRPENLKEEDVNFDAVVLNDLFFSL